jgi:hypothetical protein
MKRATFLMLALVLGAGMAIAGLNIRFALEVEVLEPDSSHALKDGGTFDTPAQAVAEAERFSRDGACFAIEEDPGLSAVCYPPARLIRTRVLKVY